MISKFISRVIVFIWYWVILTPAGREEADRKEQGRQAPNLAPLPKIETQKWKPKPKFDPHND